MAIAFVQQSGATQDVSGSTTFQRSLTGVAANSLLVLVVTNRDSDDIPVSAAGSLNATGWEVLSNPGAAIIYRIGSASGNETVTVTLNRESQAAIVANLVEFSAAGTVTLHDSDITQDNASGTSHPQGSVDITPAGLIVGTSATTGGDSSGYSAATNYTKLSDGGGFRIISQYRITTDPLTGETGTWSSGGDSFASQGVMASFVESSGGNVNIFGGKLQGLLVGKL